MTMQGALLTLILAASVALLPAPVLEANQAKRLMEFMRPLGDQLPAQGNSTLFNPKKMLAAFNSSALHDEAAGARDADRVSLLPGQPQFPFIFMEQYAGYITVDSSHGRKLFYYFVESPSHPEKKPLILWLNGGPGCSSLGTGAFEEIGPFRVGPDSKTLHKAPHPWTEVANVIFLESPAGVGFSYSDTPSDYNTGDSQTATDTFNFLYIWTQRFPEYQFRDFYITGESYAGHYIPQLANLILLKSIVNLKGIMMGNPLLEYIPYTQGWIEYLWNHAVISDEVYAAIVANCYTNPSPSLCNQATAAIKYGNIDLYNIYAPICINDGNGMRHYNEQFEGYDPCSDFEVEAYLNNPAVQKALHARPTKWVDCSNQISYSRADFEQSMVPVLQNLIASNKLKIWVYSGDFDDVVSIATTRYTIKTLGLGLKTPWRPWYTKSEVAGFVGEYNGLTMITVRGSGHMVPSNQPARALTLISSFLYNTPVPLS